MVVEEGRGSGSQELRIGPFFLLPRCPRTLTECEERVCVVVGLGSFDHSWRITHFFFVIYNILFNYIYWGDIG